MAAGFGYSTTFASYLSWARNNEKCTYKSGIMTDDEGRAHSITKIEAPSGKWTVEAIPHNEILVPTAIARLDRRLGLTSPFFSLPDDFE